MKAMGVTKEELGIQMGVRVNGLPVISAGDVKRRAPVAKFN